jgi:hypothetical protein
LVWQAELMTVLKEGGQAKTIVEARQLCARLMSISQELLDEARCHRSRLPVPAARCATCAASL